MIGAMALAFAPAPISPTLPLQIAERIAVEIIEERFEPGARLRETELAAAFGVSRATIRDALRVLENRGLVRILPQRGAQVTLLSRRELEDLFEIRATLLALASRRVAEHHGPETRKAMTAALHALDAARGDWRAYARASAAMVALISDLSGNEQLAAMIASFAQRIGRYAHLGLAAPERRQSSFARWKKLAKAIHAGDGDLAESIHRRLALENRDAALAEIEKREKKA